MPYRYLIYSAICEHAPMADSIKYPYVRQSLTCLLYKIGQNIQNNVLERLVLKGVDETVEEMVALDGGFGMGAEIGKNANRELCCTQVAKELVMLAVTH